MSSSRASVVPERPSARPPRVDALERLATFLKDVSKAEALEDRLEIPGIDGPLLDAVSALNAFLDKLWVKDFQLSAKQEMLEKVVEIRTNEVHEILDNVSAGFLIALQNETVLDNFSRSCAAIFGTSDLKGHKLSELMGMDERAQAHFSMCYEQIFEDFLPPQVSIAQLPTEMDIAGRSYHVRGAPIFGKDERVAKMFFTITDTTELRKVEAENALREALLQIVRQKDNFRAFLHETSGKFQEVREAPSQRKLRAFLHTLKGNLGCFGLHEIASLVHSIEDAPEITTQHLHNVEDTLRHFMETHEDVIGLKYPVARYGRRLSEIEQLRPVLEALAVEDSAEARRKIVERTLREMAWVSVGVLLSPLRGVVERVSTRLEKVVNFEIKGGDLTVDPDRVGAVFSNVVHLVRNSLDHGIESPDQRGNKPERARLTISFKASPNEWVLEVADDGRGIDVDAVASAAVAKGKVDANAVERMSRDERLQLIFLDGLSTKQAATEESGRGVGTTALLEAVRDVGGSLSVATALGEGTTFTVRIPRVAP
jgi:two-component system, chemotaxis family, sensor kinase CheA